MRKCQRGRLYLILLRTLTDLLHFMPQILQIIAMILGLLVGGMIEDQPAGYEGEQNLDKLEFDAFLHLLYAQHIAQ